MGPRFVIFHYFIKWYIERFGFLAYVVTVVGSVMALFTYSIMLNIQRGEKDRVMMIALLAVIVVGGLIGLGIDMSHGYYTVIK
ncbi:hypothetical protein [Peptoclostridium litorale]|uniref:hypothetical protein n=1 Tax=Peptoclostridium litorale TaxID=1557 RepID=UPI001A9A36E5|nr:hypothetical protein [Peptoclostridium litorale]